MKSGKTIKNHRLKKNCMVRHEGCSSNEFVRIPGVLSPESR